MTRPVPSHQTGTLHIVATPIGHLDDITVRALTVLRSVALIAAEDTRRSGQLLRHYQIATPLLSLHEHNERARVPALLARLQTGESVALVTDAGTPGISDPGSELIAAARRAGIRVEPVPGASAVIAALSAVGLGSEGFTFLGFPPNRSKNRTNWFESLLDASKLRPVVFFESPHRLQKTFKSLKLVNQPIYVCRELTKMHEEIVCGTVAELAGYFLEPRGEFTVIIPTPTDAGLARVIPSDEEILLEFGHITESAEPGSKREAARLVADRLHLSTSDVYQVLERAKIGRIT